MTDLQDIESFPVDTTVDADDLPERITQDEVWQLAQMIEKQTTWLLDHTDTSGNVQLEHEIREMVGAAKRTKEARQQSLERKIQGEEDQATLLEATDE